MARPVRTRVQRESDLPVIARLYLQGRTQADIAAELSAQRTYGIGRQTITRDIATLIGRWQTEAVESIGLAKRRELERLNVIEAAAWEQWEISKRPAVKATRRSRDGENAFSESQVTKEERPGDPRFLQIIQGCVDRRAAILGLNDSALAEIERRLTAMERVRP